LDKEDDEDVDGVDKFMANLISACFSSSHLLAFSLSFARSNEERCLRSSISIHTLSLLRILSSLESMIDKGEE
jgi:hypothetical protein